MIKYIIIFLIFLTSGVRANPYPISVIKGLLVSEAVIEGEKVLVIFDTGAPGLVLNSRYFSADQKQLITCQGINGTFDCSIHKVKNWSWLGTDHQKTDAILSDLSFIEKALHKKVHALIGLSVLEDYYVSIDFDQMSVSLSEKMKQDKKAIIRFQYVEHLPVIACKVNGEKKILGIDTGSEVNYLFCDDYSLDKNLVAKALPVVVIGTDNREDIKHRLYMGLDLNDNQVYQSEFIVDLLDKGSFQPESFDGLLGQSFLSQFNITIHPSRQIIILSPRKMDSAEPLVLTAQL